MKKERMFIVYGRNFTASFIVNDVGQIIAYAPILRKWVIGKALSYVLEQFLKKGFRVIGEDHNGEWVLYIPTKRKGYVSKRLQNWKNFNPYKRY